MTGTQESTTPEVEKIGSDQRLPVSHILNFSASYLLKLVYGGNVWFFCANLLFLERGTRIKERESR